MSSRIFVARDQEQFGKLSGDINPLHMDGVAARRLLFGQQLVHGLHGLMWGLDCWLEKVGKAVRVESLSATFLAPIPLEVDVDCVVQDKGETNVSIQLLIDSKPVTDISVQYSIGHGDVSSCSFMPCAPHGECRRVERESIEGGQGWFDIYLDDLLMADCFPRVAELLPAHQSSALLMTTFVVGMECPGRDSLFSGLNLSFSDDLCGSRVEYLVKDYNPIFSRLEIEYKAPGVQGELIAFVRPAPTEQVDMEWAQGRVVTGEFEGERALVIGGTRGLGETCAKLLAAGGAEVCVTYRCGKGDALRVLGEIEGAGCSCFEFGWDVMIPLSAEAEQRLQEFAPTQIYYFAAPRIGVSKGAFDNDLFLRFIEVFVNGFSEAVSKVLQLSENSLSIYVPSTSFLEEQPDGMAEYCAAKAAVEVMCDYLRKDPAVRYVRCPRLPKLATDQTAALIGEELERPGPRLLEELRNLFQEQNR